MMPAGLRSKLIRFMARVLQAAAAFAVVAMMAIVVANIIGRIFFRSPITGTMELAGFAGVIVVAVAVGFAERERRNIVVDIVAKHFPPRLRIVTDAVTFFLSLGAVGLLFWAVADSALESLAQKETTLTLSVSLFPFRVVWAGGLLFLWGLLLRHLIQALDRRSKK